jgi:hypothetical protein
MQPPSATTLLQSVPNPFNPSALIEFELARPGHVRLAIYDISSRPVRSLVDRVMSAGRHRTIWDGSMMPGEARRKRCVLYRLVASDAVITKKKWCWRNSAPKLRVR